MIVLKQNLNASFQQATKYEDPEGFGFICEHQNYKSRSFVRFMICDNKNSGTHSAQFSDKVRT